MASSVKMADKSFPLNLQPAIEQGTIEINIKAGKTAALSSVEVKGEYVAIIIDKGHLKLFNVDVQNESIKTALPYALTAYPLLFNFMELRLARPIGIKLKPVKARIIRLASTPVIVAEAEFVNEHSSANTKYARGIEETVTEEISHTWTKSSEVKIEQNINYEYDFKVAKIGGSTALSYTSSWGEDTTRSTSVTVGATSEVEVELPPGGTALATLSASQGTLDIEVEYETTVEPLQECFCFKGLFTPIFKNSARDNRQDRYKARSERSTEKISVGFYTNARIVLSDL